MNHSADPSETPLGEQLAAYVDGELDTAGCQRVQVWLAEHPEAAKEIHEQRRLAQLWRAALPPEPPEPQWATAWTGIETALTARRRHRLAGIIMLLGAVAAIVVFLMLPRPPRDMGDQPAPNLDDLISVAAPEDVDIISMEAADANTLPVGDPPVRDALDLASYNEVVVTRVEPDIDGVMPNVHGKLGNLSPMIVAPLGAENGDVTTP
jgi:hypothetical protein